MKPEHINPPEGRKFYGSVTVGERGQIVIPAEARRDFNIKPGDKLLVLGDLVSGMWIATLPLIQKQVSNSAYFVQMLESTMSTSAKPRRRK